MFQISTKNKLLPGGGISDWTRVESRDWPPFVYAFAGYVFLLFGSFPLLNVIVVRFILREPLAPANQ